MNGGLFSRIENEDPQLMDGLARSPETVREFNRLISRGLPRCMDDTPDLRNLEGENQCYPDGRRLNS